MDIDKESVREFYHGHKQVGDTRARLTNLSFTVNKGILLRCPGPSDPTPNTDVVFIGGAGVESGEKESAGGRPLAPGESVFIAVDRPMNLWVVAEIINQDIAWFGV